MPDHIAAVRAQAKRESELASSQRIKDSIQEWRNAIGANDDAWPDDWELEFWHAGYKHGAYSVIEWLASRLTREKVAIALAKRKARDWDSMSGAMQIAAIHAEYPNADAILELLERGNGEHRAPMQG